MNQNIVAIKAILWLLGLLLIIISIVCLFCGAFGAFFGCLIIGVFFTLLGHESEEQKQRRNQNTNLIIEPTNLSNISVSYGDGSFNNDESFFLFNSIGYFSMAENQVNAELISKLYIKDNKARKWTEFREEVLEIIPYYDIDILRLEYDTFGMMASSYYSWQGIQKDKRTFPYLRYSSVGGETVCKICKKLDRIILPVDNSFWDIYSPPNHFGCSCLLEQLDEDDGKHTTDLSKKKLLMPEDIFALNVGKHELRNLFANPM